MATLSTRNFNRWAINKNQGRSNNCFPSIVATFLDIDTSIIETRTEGYPARTGRKFGGTRIKWSNPAEQVRTSYSVAATDAVDCSSNTGYSLKKHGTLSRVVRDLTDGAYVVVHRGHAFGVLVVDNVAYTVDYGKGNAARRIVWTCTRLDGVDAREVLAKFTSQKNVFSPRRLEKMATVETRIKKQVAKVYSSKEVFVINNVSTRYTRKEAAMTCNCSVGRIAELVRDAKLAGGAITKVVKGNTITVSVAL